MDEKFAGTGGDGTKIPSACTPLWWTQTSDRLRVFYESIKESAATSELTND